MEPGTQKLGTSPNRAAVPPRDDAGPSPQREQNPRAPQGVINLNLGALIFTTPVLYTQAVFNLQLLTHLDLSDNDIAYLPPSISRLVNLEYLDLSKNG